MYPTIMAIKSTSFTRMVSRNVLTKRMNFFERVRERTINEIIVVAMKNSKRNGSVGERYERGIINRTRTMITPRIAEKINSRLRNSVFNDFILQKYKNPELGSLLLQ